MTGLPAERIGTIAWEAGLPVLELRDVQPSLEDAFMRATSDSIEYPVATKEATR